MNAVEAHNPTAWSRRRWGWTIAGILAVHLALIIWWSDRMPMSRPAAPPPASAYLVLDQGTQNRLAHDLAALNPMLFALPQARNFSGSAWLSLPPLDDSFPDWTDTNPPLILDPNFASPGRGQWAKSYRVGYPAVANKPEPRWFETLVPAEPLATGTVARVEGGLTGRPILELPEWRVWPHHEIASNTVVQLWVDADGYVRDAALWSECGLPDADQYAVQAAQQLRFQPLKPPAGAPARGRLVWGTLVVWWGTMALPATNQPRPAL